MEFISTKDLTNETAPEGKVLVQYLEPFFGFWTVEFAIGYFDNPNDYIESDNEDRGWKLWFNHRTINVIAYCELPEPIKTSLTEISQAEFKEKFGGFHPNLGSVGE